MNFEEIYRSKNSNIVKDFVDNDLIAFFIDINTVITKDIEGWQEEYIFKNEDKYYGASKEERKAIFDKPILEEAYYNECCVDKVVDLECLDLAALTKLLQFRLLKTRGYNQKYIQQIISKKGDPQTFIEFCIYVRKTFRNDSAHASRYTRNIMNNNDDALHKMLEKLSEELEKVSCDLKKYLIRGSKVKSVFDDFINGRLKLILDAYYMAKIGKDITYEDDLDRDIDYTELMTYNIIVDHTVFLQQSSYEAIRMLVDEGKEIFAEQTILMKLQSEQVQARTEKLYNDIKAIIVNLERWANKEKHAPKLILLENANVIEQLAKVDDTIRCCVLTMDSNFANKVWALNKANVIVLKVKTQKSFEVYKREAKKFVVDISSGSGDVILEEKINDTNADLYEESYINKKYSVDVEEQNNYRFDNENIPGKDMMVFVGEPQKGRSNTLGKLVGEGGEGDIYEFKEDGTSYAKIYKKNQLTPMKAKKIEAMVARKDEFPDNICWPQEILYNSSYKDVKVIVGYSMKKAAYKKENGTLGTIEEVIKRIIIGEYQWERKDLVRICYKCSLLFENLHSKNIWMGDVNPRNIMVDEDKEVYFIDTDNYQLSEDFKCIGGTIEFTSPEILEQMKEDDLSYASICRTPIDEYYALAVLYFYILFLTDFPYNINSNVNVKESILNQRFKVLEGRDSKRNYIWPNLTKKIQDMFTDNFTKRERYSDDKWTEAFNNMLEMKEIAKKVDDENNAYCSEENDVDNTYERKLSNEIFPYSYIKNQHETWESVKCKLCYKNYELAREIGTELKDEEKECPRCKEIRKLIQKRIYKVVCSKCKELWTINEWDIDGRDIDKLCCPDCDDEFKYSKKKDFKGKEHDREEYKKKIEKEMSYALKYYKKGMK